MWSNFFELRVFLQFQLKCVWAFKLIEAINPMISTDFTDCLSETELIKIYTLSIVNSEHEPNMDKTYTFLKSCVLATKGP